VGRGFVRRRAGIRLAVGFAVAAVLAIGASAAVAGPGDVGYEGPSYAGGALEITGEKPESKLWWNDGHWWASMFDTASSDFHIFRLNVATQTWTDTGVAIDPRAKSKADTLWDGANQKLYVASHVFSKSGNTAEPARLWRYSYNAATDAYSLDAGYPVVIANFSGETLVIDKDSTGQLWATWKQGTQIMINRTTCPASGSCPLTADAAWGTPFVPDVGITGAATVNADDISSLIAFAGQIGVMWSNQAKKGFYFAVHDDAQGNDQTWGGAARIPATGTSAFGDDHLNMKLHAADGRIFVAAKTSLGSTQARLVLLVRQTSGAWSVFEHSKGSDDMTRPIVMIDGTNNVLHFFATEEGGGALYVKKTPLSSISFGPGKGTPVIVDADNADIENPTSAKHSVSTATGLVVLASNDLTKRYWHHYDPLTGAPPPPPGNALPVASNDNYTIAQGGVLNVAAPGVLGNDADADSDPLTVQKTANPLNGTVTLQPNGAFAYTPNPSFSGTDTFKYVANDGTGDSNQATVTITVTPSGGGGGATQTFTPSNDTYVRSAYPTESNGAATSLRTYTASGKETRSYLMFNVSGLSGAVTSAKLRLFVKDASPSGGALHRISSNSWSESTLTWGTPAPALGTLIQNVGQATLNTWVEIDVTSYVTGNGTWSFAIAGISNDVAYYSSKEGTNPPELVVTS
jgi:hypothetical protein